MSTVPGVVVVVVLITVATAAAVAAGHSLAARDWSAAAVSMVVAFGLLAALFGSPLTTRTPPVERSITTAAEECRCTCTRREP